jgi:hypothetical protein
MTDVHRNTTASTLQWRAFTTQPLSGPLIAFELRKHLLPYLLEIRIHPQALIDGKE